MKLTLSFILIILTTSLQANVKVDLLIRFDRQLPLDRYKKIQDTLTLRKTLYRDLTKLTNQSQQNVWQWLSEKNIRFRPIYISNYLIIDQINEKLIKELSQLKGIAKIQKITPHKNQFLFRFNQRNTPPRQGIGSNIKMIGAMDVWKRYQITGKGIVIAGQDSGVDWKHPALIRQYRGTNQARRTVSHAYSWYDAIKKNISGIENKCPYDSDLPCDDHAHGTHTLGTALGQAAPNKYIGVAPGAQWIACRNMDNLVGNVSTYLDCFQFFFAPHPPKANPLKAGRVEFAPDIINNSWACPTSESCEGDEFLYLLKLFKLARIMAISAAGNHGDRCGTIDASPAHHSGFSLRVGGLNQAYNRVFSLSSRGPSAFDQGMGPEIVAPATFITSSTPGGRYAGQFWSGTSMAAPHLAGTIALMWEANPRLKGNIDLTTRILQQTATPFPWNQVCGRSSGRQFPNNIVGAGVVNALKAVELVKSLRL
jgi:subtilisin family serine protease